MGRLVGFLSILFLAACATPPRADHSVTNVMPDYWRFEAAGLEGPERIAAFRTDVLERHPDLYGPFIAVPTDENLGGYLDNVAPFAADMRALEPLVLSEIASQRAALTRELGPTDMTIYVAPSLFSSNGQVRWLGEGPVVMFGLDVQAYAEHNLLPGKPRDLRAYVAHELFHAWHYRANEEVRAASHRLFDTSHPPPLYQNLWIEGLATCAGHRQAPGGDAALALMSTQLLERVTPRIRDVAIELASRLESESPDDLSRYFWLRDEDPALPPARSAYAVGMLVADHALSRMSLEDAMRLQGPALRAAVAEALSAISARAVDWRDVCQRD